MALDPVAENDPHVAAHNDERTAINNLGKTTGWRYFAPGHNTNTPTYRYLVKRDGDKVSLIIPASNKAIDYLMSGSIAVGFRPTMPGVGSGEFQLTFPYVAGDRLPNSVFIGGSYDMGCSFGSSFNHDSDIFMSWITDDPFPDPLPGVADPF